jgi:serine phosphatase RsbU (regulator of sigma subunit)
MDLVVACTDGIIETGNVSGEMWGQQRFEDLVFTCVHRTPRQVVQNIVREISVFGEGHAQKDDMTLVILKVQM